MLRSSVLNLLEQSTFACSCEIAWTMERSTNITLAAMLLILAASAQAFDASLVVANVTECPVTVTKWENFTTSDLITAFAPIISSAPPSPCTAQVQTLATCAFDGSLEVQTGCCSTACAQQLQLLQDQECIPFILQAICNATANQEAEVRRFVPVLLSAADRCVGYAPPPQVECANGRVIPVELPPSAGNSTATQDASEVSTVPPVPTFPGETPANTTQAAAPQTTTTAGAATPAPATPATPTPAAAASPAPTTATSSAFSRSGVAPLLALLLTVAAVGLARL